MRIARVLGKVVLSPRLPEFKPAQYLICEAMDAGALMQRDRYVPRKTPMPESLVVFDELGAGEDSLIGVSEGREASAPFYPEHVPVDAYCCAIFDTIEYDADVAKGQTLIRQPTRKR